jgi:NADH-quinone oxidoreductase subunit H
MLAGSLSLIEITEAQEWPFLVWPPGLGFALFIVFVAGAMAEMSVQPFDMPVAESEIITGPFTEYTGMRFIFGYFFAEMAHLLAFAAIGAVLFLGGYMPLVPWEPLDVIPGLVWFFVKFAFMVFFLLWVRFSMPRLREDQLQKFGWVVLIPGSLVLIMLTGAWVLYS